MDDNNEGALRPTGDFSSLDETQNNPLYKPDEKAEVDPEEGALFQVSQSRGWEILESFIYDLEQELDTLVTQAMADGATFEEIGQKTMVKELAKAYLARVVEKVQSAKEAIEEPAG